MSLGRTVPTTLAGNPGNVFISGQTCSIPVVGSGAFTCYDYAGNSAASGTVAGGEADCGTLAVGWYYVVIGAETVYFSVIATLGIATPEDSPISLHTGLFLVDAGDRATYARLAVLAGANFVRDNLDAQELEWNPTPPGTPTFNEDTWCDDLVALYAAEKLQALIVLQDCPWWAGATRTQFWDDFRQVKEFWETIAARFAGQSQAYEPWNEADVSGHTGSEIAAWQKANYWGIRNGDSTAKIGTCPNVFYNLKLFADFACNQGYSYCDTANFHCYAWSIDDPAWEFGYMTPTLKAQRDISRGLPLWVTEIAQWKAWSTPSLSDLRLQAEQLPWTYAFARYHGCAQVFLFSLIQVDETGSKFGLMTSTLTPRPAYNAMAATGKLLAGATALGKLQGSMFGGDGQGYAFNAYPTDATLRQVIVARAATTDTLTLPSAPDYAYDHLGRSLSLTTTYALTTAPIFIVFAAGTVTTYDAPPASPVCGLPPPSPAFLHLPWPDRSKVRTKHSAYVLDSTGEQSFTVTLYNLSASGVTGTFTIEAPAGWTVGFPASQALSANDKQTATLTVDCSGSTGELINTVRIFSDFGATGKDVLSLRFMPDPSLPRA